MIRPNCSLTGGHGIKQPVKPLAALRLSYQSQMCFQEVSGCFILLELVSWCSSPDC